MSGDRGLVDPLAELRVAVLCEDPWARRGLASGLAEQGVPNRLVVPPTPDGLAEEGWRWPTHLLLVPEVRGGWDRFAMVDVARRVREVQADLVVVALTAVAADPYLRLRAGELGDVQVVDMTQLDDPVDLVRRLRFRANSRGAMRPPLVGERSQPSAVLDYVRGRRLEGVFDGTATPLGRRPRITLRQVIATLGDLSTSPERRTGGPMRDTSLPTWREVFRFVNGLRGAGEVEPAG